MHEKQLEELKRLIGLDIDFEHITSKRGVNKDLEAINAHKKAVQEGDLLAQQNKDLEEELKRAVEELKKLHKEYDDLQEEKSCQYIIVRENIDKIKAEIKEYERKKASREQYYTNLKNKQEEIVEANAENMINDKAIIVGSVKSILKAKEKMAKDTKMMRETQRVAEGQLYKDMAEKNARNYENEKNLLMKKYSSLIEEQKREYEKYVNLYQDFRKRKK